ncbi:unnamed protein product [Adineta ricciae]|uniref:Uncharacterized protein n=1 Tax=Adineta ricciae TaxID=249248 RepID=A0A815T9G2_ADIRI|nr:unnamed protein product [Adineta ricciae]
MYLVFFHFGTILPTIPIMCRIWWLIDYGFYCGQIILMSWLAIERHILIFYDQWISNRRPWNVGIHRWSKQRRMIIQLTLVSALDVSLNTPIFFIPLLRRFGLPSDFGIQPELYFFYFGYFVVFLFPFASLCQYPDLRRTLKRKLCLVCERSHRKVLA